MLRFPPGSRCGRDSKLSLSPCGLSGCPLRPFGNASAGVWCRRTPLFGGSAVQHPVRAAPERVRPGTVAPYTFIPPEGLCRPMADSVSDSSSSRLVLAAVLLLVTLGPHLIPAGRLAARRFAFPSRGEAGSPAASALQPSSSRSLRPWPAGGRSILGSRGRHRSGRLRRSSGGPWRCPGGGRNDVSGLPSLRLWIAGRVQTAFPGLPPVGRTRIRPSPGGDRRAPPSQRGREMRSRPGCARTSAACTPGSRFSERSGPARLRPA